MVPGMLSVIMPNYNHSAYITGQITAILTQSYRKFELIVIDDCSTDNSVEVINQAIKGDDRARLLCNEQNKGVNFNIHKGRKIAEGEFLYFAAADDHILPGFFEKSITTLMEFPETGLSFAVMAWIDPGGNTATPMPMQLYPAPAHFSPEAFCELICGEHITGHTSIFRTEAFNKASPTLKDMDSLKWVSDWFIGSIVACRTGVCHIPEPLVAIRQTGSNYGNGMADWTRQKDVVYTILRLLKSKKYRDVLPYFAQGQLMSNLGFVGRAVAANPEFWNVETLMLVQEPLVAWALERQKKQKEHWRP